MATSPARAAGALADAEFFPVPRKALWGYVY